MNLSLSFPALSRLENKIEMIYLEDYRCDGHFLVKYGKVRQYEEKVDLENMTAHECNFFLWTIFIKGKTSEQKCFNTLTENIKTHDHSSFNVSLFYHDQTQTVSLCRQSLHGCIGSLVSCTTFISMGFKGSHVVPRTLGAKC